MLLIRPNPGACVDRQTILDLKIAEAPKMGIDPQHFEMERRAVQLYLEQSWFAAPIQSNWKESFNSYFSELAKVNQELWVLEDEIRYVRSLSGEEKAKRKDRIVSIALAIPALNDERAVVVGKIDALFGITAPEKIYRLPDDASKSVKGNPDK
jgi:hypothetical protein